MLKDARVDLRGLCRAVLCCAVLCCNQCLQSMFAGFLEADKTCRARFPRSGTTATLAIVVGWEVIVANVGDSAAYLDTGKQVRLYPCRCCSCLSVNGCLR